MKSGKQKRRKKRSGFGPHIRKQVQEQVNNRKNDGSFLEDNKIFNNESRMPEEYQPHMDNILKKINEGKKVRSMHEWEMILSCLVANLTEDRYTKSLAISKDRRNKAYSNRYSQITPKIIKIMDRMESLGMIESVPGMHFRNGKKSRSRLPRIWRTPKLLECIDCLPSHIVREDKKEVVILKGPKNKAGNRSLIDYDDTDDITNKLRREINTINRVNKRAEITLFIENEWVYKDGVRTLFVKNEWVNLHTQVYAVFIENFDQWGRLYSSGWYNHQQYSEDDRKKIQINGENVVELDFRGLHPHLLYAQEGIQFEDYAECSGYFEKPDDPYAIKGLHEDLRPFLKTMLLSMLNSDDFTKAQGSCNKWLRFQKDIKKYKDKDDYKNACIEAKNKFNTSNYRNLSRKDKKYFADVTRTRELGIYKARPLMEKFMEVHKPIQKYLCNGCSGLQVTNKDSKMATAICMEFAKKNRAILPIHDSFLVQDRFANDLMETMNKIYKRFNKNLWCPIH